LDSLPFPHKTARAVLHEFDRYPISAFSHVFAIRGCPYRCFFCGSRNIWGDRVRFRSVQNVVREIHSLVQAGATNVHFDDDTFGIRADYTADLCRLLAENCPRLAWSCELHVNLVREETIRRMKEAGCVSIQLGIESGDDGILRAIRKGFTIDRAIAAADLIERTGIAVQAFFMVGFPQETRASLQATARAMRRVRGRLSYSIFTPYPGTEAFEYCRRRGLVGEDFDVSLYNHQSPANCFCEHIPHAEFRERVRRIELLVDRRNDPHPLRKLLSGRGVQRLRELGVAGSLRKAGGLIGLGRSATRV